MINLFDPNENHGARERERESQALHASCHLNAGPSAPPAIGYRLEVLCFESISPYAPDTSSFSQRKEEKKIKILWLIIAEIVMYLILCTKWGLRRKNLHYP